MKAKVKKEKNNETKIKKENVIIVSSSDNGFHDWKYTGTGIWRVRAGRWNK